MTAKIINIRNTECPNCPELQPVNNIDADFAFIELAGEVFENAIRTNNYSLAMQVADQLLITANRLGQYAIHRSHI
jgi:hypothetical protein